MGIVLRGNDPVLFEAAHGRKDREHVAFEVAQILVGCDERAVDIALVVNAAAVEMRVVTHVEQRKQGRHQVDLRNDAPDMLRLDEARGVDQCRDMVFFERDFRASGNTPAALDEFVKQHPAAKNLLVPVERFAQTRKALETAGTAESILYNKIKNEL